MNNQTPPFNFDTAFLPHITVVSTDLYTERELTFTESDIQNNPVEETEILVLAFAMEGMIESNFKGIKPSFLSTANTSSAVYAPFENQFRLPGRQRFDAFTVSIKKDFFTTLANEGDQWAEGIVGKINKQEPFSLCPKPFATTAPLQHLIHQIRHSQAHSSLHKLYIQSKISNLLYYYFKQTQDLSVQKRQEGFSLADVAKLQELKLHLQNNFLENHTLEGLAKWCGFNLFKLKRGFKLVHGTSVFEYIRQLRMEHAATLLRNTQLNVGEVAHELGYSHLNHFSIAFKKHFGLPPTQWK